MLRITIQKDGSVTGDVSRIMAYEGQQYSEDIKFSYPAIGDEYVKYVRYSWGTTTFENMLDYEDKVQLLVCGCGVVTVQWYAKNPITGAVGLVSKPFDLIVHKSLGPDGFTNCYRHNCMPSVLPHSPGNGSVEQMVKFGIELEEESEVRAAQDSLIWEEILNIKNKLAEAGISTVDPVATVEDCNKLISAGEYHLKDGSLNTPDGAEGSITPYIVQVKKYNTQVLQTANAADDGDTRIFYRTGTILNDTEVLWQAWIPMIHEATVEEV